MGSRLLVVFQLKLQILLPKSLFSTVFEGSLHDSGLGRCFLRTRTAKHIGLFMLLDSLLVSSHREQEPGKVGVSEQEAGIHGDGVAKLEASIKVLLQEHIGHTDEVVFGKRE